MKGSFSCAVIGAALCCPLIAFGQDVPGPAEWRQFRETYPYHVQGVAVSKPRADGSRVLIVAEPPAHINRGRLSTILAGAASVRFPVLPIGHDGWVRDAVAVIPSGRDVGELVDTLHREMFGTTYKAFVLPVAPGQTIATANASVLNLQVSAGDLARWLFPVSDTATKRALRFTQLGSITPVTADEILDRALRGVFVSSQPGLVLCAVSSAMPLVNARTDLRRFVLDSDLILGAFRKGAHVVIVGRERVAPVTVLPPLRVETILQLATVGQDELSQSYERLNIIAGRYDDKHDWAPIYLSAALVDTEYGSLLNITDQLLKSWSMKGLVHYERFAYPAPATYPFAVPLNEYVNASRITFNWNTKGAGYVVARAGLDILALNRTGALPVDYLGGENARIALAEDKAYEYFTGTGDPNLVRVVQYAGLYQIFRRFGVTTPADNPVLPNVTPAAARKGADMVVRELRRLSAAKITAAIRRESTGPDADPAFADVLRGLLAVKLAVEALYEAGGDAGLNRLGEALAAPREFHPSGPGDEMILKVARQVMGARLQDLLDLPLKPIKEQYVADSARAVDGWIRTPSIVVSWMDGLDGEPGRLIGGHNLSAQTSSMRVDPTVPAGTIRVVESQRGRVLLFNPADESRIAAVVRQFGRGAEKPKLALEAELRTVLRSTPATERPLAEALAFRTPASGTRGLSTQHVPTGGPEVGWSYAETGPSATQIETLRAVADPQSPVWVVERADNGVLSVYSDGGRTLLAAGNSVSAADAVTELISSADPLSGPIRVHVRGLNANQAKGLMQSVEARLPREARGRLAGTVEDRVLGAQDLRQLMAADYDFTRARVSRVGDAIRTREGVRIDMDVSIPAIRAEKPPLLVRVKLLFQSMADVSAQLMASVRQVVQKWVLGFEPGLSPGALSIAKQRLHLDLKSVHPQLEVDIFLDDRVLITDNLDGLVVAIPAAA